MQSITKHAIYIFLIIFALTALMCLGALGYLWYSSIANNSKTDLPYLSWLLGVVIAEVVGFVVVLAKKGVKFLPEVKMNETEDQTFKFMLDFINSGSSVVIVSNRVALIEIITPEPITPKLTLLRLESAGVKLFVTHEDMPPEARFTLVNGDRSGAEKLAIARGSHPDHEITILDHNSAPQIIALAKDIVRKSKAIANAK